MRIILIGTVESTLLALKILHSSAYIVAGVVTSKNTDLNSDWVDLAPYCDEMNIPLLYVQDNKIDQIQQWVKSQNPDLAVCIGWSHLLNQSFLDIPRLGCIGYHPAALPKNRGRHPLIWALVLGLKETASTLFKIDLGADSGPILSQRIIDINEEDTARTLYDKVLRQLPEQLIESVELISTQSNLPQQNHSLANTWRKRSAKDGRIDFRLASTTIYNLVRAITRPYPGATVDWCGQENKVWAARKAEWIEDNLEPGKVLALNGQEILIKTADAAIWLTEHDIFPLPKIGDYF